MSFIHNELLPRLEANAITREEMQTYLEDLKNLKEKFFGKVKIRLDILAFFSYNNSFGEAFHCLAKISLVEKPDYFYLSASKYFDSDGWQVWEIKSKFANDHKHTQHDLQSVVNPVNWYYFSFIDAQFNTSLAGEYFDLEVPEAMSDYYHQSPTTDLDLNLSLLQDVSEDVVITSRMTQKEYNDVISFYI